MTKRWALCYDPPLMKRERVPLIVALLIFWNSAASHSADYQIKTVEILPIESYPARMTVGQVTVAANPYETDEKSHTAFDVKNLNSHGYFPLHVIVHNGSRTSLTLRTRDMVLVSGGGQEFYTFPATLVVQEVVGGGLTDKIPIVRSKDRSTSTKTGSPLMDFTQKELTNRNIEPGGLVGGFVFFYTKEKKRNIFSGARLRIPGIINDDTNKPVGVFEIPLDPALRPRTTGN